MKTISTLRPLCRLMLLAGLLVGLLVFGGTLSRTTHAQSAATITVTTCDESHLDAAIAGASSGDTITFGCSGDIGLTQTLTISQNLTLDGSGQNVTLDGQNAVQVLYVNGGVTFTLNALTVAHGTTPTGYPGGGLDNEGGTVNISNSTFATNSAYSGGGLDNDYGTVNISNSTFANNSVTSIGGGLYNGGTVNISNSTFANNSAYKGGAIFTNAGGMVNISNSTFANNSASFGGGLDNYYSTVNMSTSIISNNSTGNCYQGGTFTDQGYNLSSDSSCGFTTSTSQQNTDPKLDPNGLQNNGGLTQTIALQDGSPAIDQIPAASCPATDQRSLPRPDDSETTCDIGAYESGAKLRDNDLALTNVPANITTNATGSQGAVVTYTPPTVVDEDSPLPPVNCTPASGSTFAIGTTTVTCTVTDSDDSNSPVSATFSVTVQPVLSATVSNVTATEGSSFSGVVATGTAYGTSNPLSATITWGDGSNSAGSVTLNADGTYSVSGSHTYGEEGSYPLSVTVKDSGSLSATANGTAKVADAALTLTIFAASSLPQHSAGVAATFSDADPAGTVSDYTATVNWGDGTTSTVKVIKNPVGKGFVLGATHSYAKAGHLHPDPDRDRSGRQSGEQNRHAHGEISCNRERANSSLPIADPPSIGLSQCRGKRAPDLRMCDQFS